MVYFVVMVMSRWKNSLAWGGYLDPGQNHGRWQVSNKDEDCNHHVLVEHVEWVTLREGEGGGWQHTRLPKHARRIYYYSVVGARCVA